MIASGGIRTPVDMAKAIALGADGVVIGTAELVAVGCIRCGCCESGRGCARGIATTDPELLEMVTVEWCTQRLVNLYTRLARDAGRHPVPPGARLRRGAARPDRPVDPPRLRRPELSTMTHNGHEPALLVEQRPTGARFPGRRLDRFATTTDRAEAILRSRADLRPEGEWFPRSPEAEGGCGVTGFACTIPVGGKHIYEPSIQMRNRGNGKGGGIAACGLVPEEMGVSRKVLEDDYILQVALLDPGGPRRSGKDLHRALFRHRPGRHGPHGGRLSRRAAVGGSAAGRGPLLRPRQAGRAGAISPRRKGFRTLPSGQVEDEFVFQNSLRLNTQFYASLGDKRAFVMSHARNLIILKIVGYAEAAVQYYRMPDTRAHVWIAHQRYPTKGRVWHPGGAHPFIGSNEALVHNGDFANYHSVCEYLAGRNIFPQFLTDTEVSVLLFDLWNRVYKYPVEYIIEALAPTTELDFDRLPAEKQRIYRQIQAAHVHASPDGPWFFIIARSLTESKSFQLLGITDTAMLRPQVFALQEGEVSIGLICSEKQAIDATLASLAAEDPRFTPVADIYWNARGGSHTDGGAFLLTVSPKAMPQRKAGHSSALSA